MSANGSGRRFTGMPATMDSFVGRKRELDRIGELLADPARLITLTGTGGIGKTRLATEAVRRRQQAGYTSIWWVRLARLAAGSDTAAVQHEVIRSVVETDFSGRAGWEVLVDTLDITGETPLLILDNCEHVLPGAGSVLAELLEAIPSLTVLATSREPIGWFDEHVVAVRSLSPPSAVQLFRHCAELAGRPIAEGQLADAEQICRHVDNNPLYIRLAAARLRHRPAAMIHRELSGESDDQRLRWTHGPRAGSETRHRGVRDVIAWSYNLCAEDERLLFDRMSVFAAGFDAHSDTGEESGALGIGAELEAIRAVCADDPATDHDIEPLLEKLVDRSLVTVHITTTTVRYSLLECLRVFAAERLRERSAADEGTQLRLVQRHRRYYRDKIVAAQADWFGPREQDYLDWARAEWDNILLAIEGSLRTPREPEIGLEICVGLTSMRAPFFRGSLREIRHWTERTLAASDPTTDLGVTAAAMIVWITLCQGRHRGAQRLLDDCIAACPHARAATVATPAWRSAPETEAGLPAPVEFAWGAELMLVQRDPRSVTVFARARAKFAAVEMAGGAMTAELFEALAAGFLCSPSVALTTAQRHLEHTAASGARWAHSWAQLAWALALIKNENPGEALTAARSALTQQLATRDRWGVVWSVHICTWAMAQRLTDRRAASTEILRATAAEIALLAGGAATLRNGLGVDLDGLGPFADETASALATARQMLGHKEFTELEKQGAALRPEWDEPARLALGTLRSPLRPAATSPQPGNADAGWAKLTRAEQEVALLAAAGWTNAAIAARRSTAAKTVDAQMSAVFQKLLIGSRAEIIRCVPPDRIEQVRTESAQRPHRASGRG